jgi:hypothetical protein
VVLHPRSTAGQRPARPAWLCTTSLLPGLIVVLAVSVASGLNGCSRRESTPAANAGTSSTAQREGQREYVVRARIERLPEPGRPGGVMVAYHEPIDDFADVDGRVVGMNSMAMDFPLAPGVSAAGLRVGDVVELRFRTWPEQIGSVRVLSWDVLEIRPLPAGTPVRSGRANPPSAPPSP